MFVENKCLIYVVIQDCVYVSLFYLLNCAFFIMASYAKRSNELNFTVKFPSPPGINHTVYELVTKERPYKWTIGKLIRLKVQGDDVASLVEDFLYSRPIIQEGRIYMCQSVKNCWGLDEIECCFDCFYIRRCYLHIHPGRTIRPKCEQPLCLNCSMKYSLFQGDHDMLVYWASTRKVWFEENNWRKRFVFILKFLNQTKECENVLRWLEPFLFYGLYFPKVGVDLLPYYEPIVYTQRRYGIEERKHWRCDSQLMKDKSCVILD